MNDSTNYTQRSNAPTERDLNNMLNAHRRFCRNYQQCRRKMRAYRYFKYSAWLLFAGDIYFTYQGVALYSGSTEFGLFSALAVGALQWTASESLLTRSLRDLLTVDRNRDGKATMDEWLRWGITVGSLVMAYGLDITTNLMAIDAGALGEIPFKLANIPSNGFLTNLMALFICLALVFSDEMIHNLADNRLSQLAEEEPELKKEAAKLEARIQAASGFSYEVLTRAEEQGRREGQNWKV